MLWMLLIVAVLALLVYLLFMPLDLVVDTRSHEYFCRAGHLVKARVTKDDQYLLRTEIRALGIPFQWYPLRRRTGKKKPVKRKRSKFKWSYLKKAGPVLRTFKVKHCSAIIDTGNVITNARLYPIFASLNYFGGDFRVNFNGNNELHLHLKNTPMRILKSLINP